MFSDHGIGILCAFLAAFFTGSYQVPRKLPSLRKALPPLSDGVFMAYFSWGFAAAAALSAPLLLQHNRELMKSLLVGTDFVFTWWGILAGAMVGVAIRLSFFSVSLMGIALNAAVSMGAAAVTSFVWGVAVNNDRVKLLWIDVLAVLLVIGGGAIAALFKETRQTAGEIRRMFTQEEHSLRRWLTRSRSQPSHGLSQGGPRTELEAALARTLLSSERQGTHRSEEDEEGRCRARAEPLDALSLKTGSDSLKEENATPSLASKESGPEAPLISRENSNSPFVSSAVDPEAQRAWVRAAAACTSLFSGVVGGCSLGLLAFVPPEAKGLAFLPSFALGLLFTATLALLVEATLCVWPAFHPKVALIPGLLSGSLHFLATLCVILAIPRISFSVAYPTKQSAVIFSGLWGILLFQELRGKSILVFGVGSIMILSGVALLATFTYPARLHIPEEHHMPSP